NAYVDGELGTRQRKAIQRLLHKSAEARQILRQLEQDADQVRRLPRRKVAADFPFQILGTISERGLQPGGGRAPVAARATRLPRRRSRPARGRSAWCWCWLITKTIPPSTRASVAPRK